MHVFIFLVLRNEQKTSPSFATHKATSKEKAPILGPPNFSGSKEAWPFPCIAPFASERRKTIF
jgi:hypothetical protein